MLPRKEGEPHFALPESPRHEPRGRPPYTHRVPSPAVEFSGLVKAYGAVRAVDGLTLAADSGRITAVLGPNGAGKTTAIECAEGLRSPDAGTVRVLGLDPVRDGAGLRARVGVMLQDGGLPSGAPTLACLRHVAAMYARPRDIDELSERLGLEAFARTTVRRLSGGQRQRLALACAVVGRPEVVFLDEPSAGLDPQGRRAVWDLVAELRAAGVSVVLTTHLMEEAETLADHVVIVDHGRVIAEGSPADLRAAGGPPGIRFAGPPGLASALTRDVPEVVVEEIGGGAYLARPVAAESQGVSRAAGRDDTEPGGGDRDVAARIAALTAWGASHGILLTEFTPGSRSLEDVFLDLTGRALR